MLIRRGGLRWWENYTLLSDTPEKRADREQRFREEASRIFRRGIQALGENEAKKIWGNVAKKRGGKKRGTIHKRDQAAALLDLYDEAVKAQSPTPKATAIRKFKTKAGSKDSEPTIRKQLERLLTRRAEAEKKRAEMMALYDPGLLSKF